MVFSSFFVVFIWIGLRIRATLDVQAGADRREDFGQLGERGDRFRRQELMLLSITGGTRSFGRHGPGRLAGSVFVLRGQGQVPSRTLRRCILPQSWRCRMRRVSSFIVSSLARRRIPPRHRFVSNGTSGVPCAQVPIAYAVRR